MSSLRDKLLANAVKPQTFPLYLGGLDHHLVFVPPTKMQMQRAGMHVIATSEQGDQLAELIIALVRWGLREQSGKLALGSYADAEMLIDSLDDTDTATLQAVLHDAKVLSFVDPATSDDADAEADPVSEGKASSGTTPDC